MEDMVESVRELEGQFEPATVRKYAADNFSVTRMVREYIDLYSEIVGEKRTPRSLGRLSPVEFVPEPELASTLQATLDSDIANLTDEPEEPQAVA
jgi:hypothetical protein